MRISALQDSDADQEAHRAAPAQAVDRAAPEPELLAQHDELAVARAAQLLEHTDLVAQLRALFALAREVALEIPRVPRELVRALARALRIAREVLGMRALIVELSRARGELELEVLGVARKARPLRIDLRPR